MGRKESILLTVPGQSSSLKKVMGEIQGRNLEEETMEECSLLAHSPVSSLNHALLAEFLI